MPKTIDGVEIYGGEIIWNCWMQPCRVDPVIPGRKTSAWGPIRAPEKLQLDYHVVDCYSTRSAAIAAERKLVLERLTEVQRELARLDALEATPEDDLPST